MYFYPETVVLRHHKERLSKCSLRGLESRDDFSFYRYPCKDLPDVGGYILLSIGAPPLGVEDKERGLFVLDATWRYAEKMQVDVAPRVDVVYRSIPTGARTAYPRKQDDCLDAEAGLASIEAIYIAYHILGRPVDGLLENYYWRDRFLDLNAGYLDSCLPK